MRIGQAVGDFGQLRMIPEEHHQNTYCHENQRYGKYRIDLTDNLVDGQQRSQYIIDEHDGRPKREIKAFGCQLSQQPGRTCHENRADKYHQQDGKPSHELFEVNAQIASYGFGQTFSPVSQRDHTRQKIVNRTGKNTAQNDPQI